jgi:type IV secretory pathway ATPase VirB11/archaellum biosynthesis ATPase
MAEEKQEEKSNYDMVREGEDVIVRIDYEKSTIPPSLEDSPICMARTMDILIEAGNATKIVFVQKRDYEYDYIQTQMLLEIAKLANEIVKQKGYLNYKGLLADAVCSTCIPGWYGLMQNILFSMMKSDPLGAYVELKRLEREEKIKYLRLYEEKCKPCEQKLIALLKFLIHKLDNTKLITVAKPYLAGYKIGDRSVYRKIFIPSIKPDFMFTKLMAAYPTEAEEIDSYTMNGIEVSIFSLPDTVQYLYHVTPPEFKLSEEKYDVLDQARHVMAEHKPKKSEFTDPERMREVFFSVGRDLIEELSNQKQYNFRKVELDQLASILVRYTVGFGLIEILLQDEKVQDITINSPMGRIPMFLVHQDYDECKTNIIPTIPDAESWASKLRMISGRPLDEANPILDTELTIPGASARIAIISPPLNPTGLAYSFRRHRDKPWTLSLFIKNGMINEIAAGILSFLIDGSRTLLVAGTRSAGKSSLLGSLLVEIMRKKRIITIEDTLELPTVALRKMGYNIQSMKVASALTKGTSEVSAEEGIRTTLRMGDSCLIVGEVRSTEAKALYEAMRVGALANTVAGTIHGDSPYGVYDRVVNDLEVPKTSFKATDIVIVANPIKSADGLHRWRRVTQITEVRKFWEEDPLLEGGFVDLMKYDAKEDKLNVTADLLNGESDILKSIAGSVKEWAGNWDAVWDNVMLRAKIKKTMVDYADKSNMPDIIEAKFSIQSNDEFHKISDKVKTEIGNLDSKQIFFEWDEWIKREIRKLKRSGIKI